MKTLSKMKRMRSFVAALSVMAGLIGLPFDAESAPRELSIGLGGGYTGYNNGGYAKLYFHYQPFKYLRLSPEVGYMIKNDNKSGIEFSFDLHSPFRVGRGVSVYPLVGFTANQWHITDQGNTTKVGLDLGAGLDLYMTSNLKINFQGKYSFMKKTSGCFIDLGVAYIF